MGVRKLRIEREKCNFSREWRKLVAANGLGDEFARWPGTNACTKF
jgi:hypothetical protein